MIIILNIIAHMSDYTLQHYTLPHPRYHNGKEFYRHIPSDHPPTTVYSQPGLIVDVSGKTKVLKAFNCATLHSK